MHKKEMETACGGEARNEVEEVHEKYDILY